jgi:Fur family peroxide stress response transcriptional regulator
MISVEQGSSKLREAGLRLTPQRRALLEELAGDTSHPSADAVAARVARRVPGVSVSTVYKGLHELASLGLVRELDLPGALRFDPDTAPHAHLLCDSCRAVVDIELDRSLVDHLLAETAGARVDGVDIVFRGDCASCLKR